MANPAGAPGGMRSFLQAASKVTEEAPTPLRVVQMEGLAVLKIIKHFEEFAPALVTGRLLGLDAGSVLEVTNCFPFPTREGDEEADADGANYQLEMMKCLREVNVDNNTIGWYQSCLQGFFQTVELLETFVNYQENIRRCVCIVYDPSRSSQGVLALKALRLTDTFMDLYHSCSLTGEKLREKKLSWVDMFEEIPIKVSNSALVSTFMKELEPETPVSQCDFDRLKLSTAPFMERNFAVDATKFVWDCLNQDDDDELLGLLGNQTPMRDCHDFFADIGDITCNETLDPEESQESKRRRMLEYPSESNQSGVPTRETASTLVASEVTDVSLLCTDEPRSLSYDTQNNSNSNDSDTINPFSCGVPYMAEDNHLENFSDTTSMYFRLGSQESVTYIDDQTDLSGTSDVVPITESLIMQKAIKLSTLKVSKGGRLGKAEQDITTSIVYPFTIIKPSWEETDVTLNDINQRIRAPLKKPPEILGTSAFSGKPVIGKTRIKTDGGKGSITILRTKG